MSLSSNLLLKLMGNDKIFSCHQRMKCYIKINFLEATEILKMSANYMRSDDSNNYI